MLPYDFSYYVLYEASPFFRDICDRRPEKDKDLDFYMEEEYDYFNNFIQCVNSRNITKYENDEKILLEVYFIAVRFRVNWLQNLIMDRIMAHKTTDSMFWLFENIKRIYQRTNNSSKLRWGISILVIRAIQAGILFSTVHAAKKNTWDSLILRIGKDTPEFTYDLLKVQLTYSIKDWGATVEVEFWPCEFHIHAPQEKCANTGRQASSISGTRNLEGALRKMEAYLRQQDPLIETSCNEENLKDNTKTPATRSVTIVGKVSKTLTVLDDGGVRSSLMDDESPQADSQDTLTDLAKLALNEVSNGEGSSSTVNHTTVDNETTGKELKEKKKSRKRNKKVDNGEASNGMVSNTVSDQKANNEEGVPMDTIDESQVKVRHISS